MYRLGNSFKTIIRVNDNNYMYLLSKSKKISYFCCAEQQLFSSRANRLNSFPIADR